MNESYIIGFKARAVAELDKLDKQVIDRLIGKLLWLAQYVEVVSHETLKGEWESCFRYRIGDYRAIYTVESENHLIIVQALGHRREIYD